MFSDKYAKRDSRRSSARRAVIARKLCRASNDRSPSTCRTAVLLDSRAARRFSATAAMLAVTSLLTSNRRPHWAITSLSWSSGTNRKNPAELRTAISSFVSGPVTVAGSVKSRRPPGFSKRAHSAITRGRLGRWLIAINTGDHIEACTREW